VLEERAHSGAICSKRRQRSDDDDDDLLCGLFAPR